MAAKFGRYRIGLNSRAKPFSIIMNIVMLFIWLYVGDMVITTIMTLLRTEAPETCVPLTNTFYNVFSLFGVQCASSTNGLTGVIGLILGVGVLIQAIRVTRV